LKTSAAALQGRVQELAGHEFNVNSTQQLRTVLYDELGSTGEEDQDRLLDRRPDPREPAREHPIIDALLSYREVEKLRSTTARTAGRGGRRRQDPRLLPPDRRPHRAHLVDRPNLHNIPVRTELGKQFRRAFVPARVIRPGGRLRQVELR